MRLTIKQGDTRHAIRATLKDVNNNPVDLSAAQVDFIMQSKRPGTAQVIRRVQQTADVGEVWVVFQDGDTAISGYYKAEFKVVYSDGKVETFPHAGVIAITIEPSLGGV